MKLPATNLQEMLKLARELGYEPTTPLDDDTTEIELRNGEFDWRKGRFIFCGLGWIGYLWIPRESVDAFKALGAFCSSGHRNVFHTTGEYKGNDPWEWIVRPEWKCNFASCPNYAKSTTELLTPCECELEEDFRLRIEQERGIALNEEFHDLETDEKEVVLELYKAVKKCIKLNRL